MLAVPNSRTARRLSCQQRLTPRSKDFGGQSPNPAIGYTCSATVARTSCRCGSVPHAEGEIWLIPTGSKSAKGQGAACDPRPAGHDDNLPPLRGRVRPRSRGCAVITDPDEALRAFTSQRLRARGGSGGGAAGSMRPRMLVVRPLGEGVPENNITTA